MSMRHHTPHTPHVPQRRHRVFALGFTLVELVAVTIIIAILAGIALPRFSHLLGRQRADATTRRIETDLDLARRTAMNTSSSQTVIFDTLLGTYELVGMPHPDHPTQSYIVSLAEKPYEATILAAYFGGDSQIVFDGWGKPDTGGTVVIQVGDTKAAVTVEAESGETSGSEVASVSISSTGITTQNVPGAK